MVVAGPDRRARLLFEDAIDAGLRNLWITAAMLASVSLILLLADRMARTSAPGRLTWKHAVLFGLAQAAALIPGVSRSGATISAGLFMGYRREASARYAFLLAIPAVMASGLYKLKDIGGDTTVSWGPTILATVIAFFIGYAVIAWLLRYVSTHNFTIFVVYRLLLAAGLAVLLGTGTLAAI